MSPAAYVRSRRRATDSPPAGRSTALGTSRRGSSTCAPSGVRVVRMRPGASITGRSGSADQALRYGVKTWYAFRPDGITSPGSTIACPGNSRTSIPVAVAPAAGSAGRPRTNRHRASGRSASQPVSTARRTASEAGLPRRTKSPPPRRLRLRSRSTRHSTRNRVRLGETPLNSGSRTNRGTMFSARQHASARAGWSWSRRSRVKSTRACITAAYGDPISDEAREPVQYGAPSGRSDACARAVDRPSLSPRSGRSDPPRGHGVPAASRCSPRPFQPPEARPMQRRTGVRLRSTTHCHPASASDPARHPLQPGSRGSARHT